MRAYAAGAVLALLLIVGSTTLTAGTPPTINVWNGSYQRFGVIGTPQRRANILGNVWHPSGISSLKYTLNGGVPRTLSFLPDDRRLSLMGDFNVDIRFDEMVHGLNTVVISAVATTGDTASTVVNVDNLSGQTWPIFYSTGFTQLVDSVQIVDGKWGLMDGGARILEPGYDRMLAIGDTTWTDYEVTAQVTVWGLDSTFAAWDDNNGGPGIGFLMRWHGHTNQPTLPITQPLSGYLPCGAIGWYHWGKSYWKPAGTNQWEIDAPYNGDLKMRQSNGTVPLYYGVPYLLKMQVKWASGMGPLYKFKVWQLGYAEPGWLMTQQEPLTALGTGSLVLLAHHVSATFQWVKVTPAPDGIPPVITNIAATPTSTTATITWSTDEQATSSVSYGLASPYENTVSDLTNLVTGHSMLLQDLQPNSTYQYTVTSADFGGATSTSTVRTFQTLTLTTPPAPTIVFPGNGSSGNPTALTVRWNKAATATGYRLLLGTDATFLSGVVVDDATLTDTLRAVSGLLPGTRYYWKVSARNSAGEGPFCNVATFLTGLDFPVLASPANGALNVSPTPKLSWHPVLYATSYRVRVSTNSNLTGTPVFEDSLVTDTSRVASGMTFGQKYYWGVQPKNAAEIGPWSSVWSFTAGLASPTLLSPANGSTNQSVNSTLRWGSVTLATSYDVQVATNASFTSGVIVSDSMRTDTTRALVGLSPGTVYYWRARARNATGTSEWSPVWSFQTGLSQAQLQAPANGSTGQPVNLTFIWRKVSNATSYAFQLGTDPTFTTGLFKNDASITDTTRFVANLFNKTTYYWHVRALQGGTTGPWSTTWWFTTVARVPDVVTLIELPDGVSDVSENNVRFIWNRSQPGVTRYWFELALDTGFTLTRVDSMVMDSTTVVNALTRGSNYYWRVRAANGDGWGAFSQIRTFHVGPLSVESEPGQGLPKSLALEQNYPNPFNPSTRIRFAIPSEKQVRLDVYSVLGERVATLVDDRLTAGVYSVQLDGFRLASGVYYYRLVTPESVITRKMLLVK